MLERFSCLRINIPLVFIKSRHCKSQCTRALDRQRALDLSTRIFAQVQIRFNRFARNYAIELSTLGLFYHDSRRTSRSRDSDVLIPDLVILATIVITSQDFISSPHSNQVVSSTPVAKSQVAPLA